MTTDLRHAARSLRRSPAFAIAALLTLALGIGANTAIFSVVHAVLLRPLPYPDAGRIVHVYETNARGYSVASPPDFTDWRAGTRSFAGMAAYTNTSWALTGDGSAEQVSGNVVTEDFFRVMGVSPAAGRGFSAEETRDGGPRAVLLSDAFWRRRFGSDRALLGRTIVLDGEPYVVAGVMPRGFDFPAGTDIWAPLTFSAEALATQRGAHYIDIVARLRPDVDIAAANRDLEAVAARIHAQYPTQNIGASAAAVDLREAEVGDARSSLLLLLGAVALVLLIACVNVANLLLARSTGRAREIAVRAALGAGGSRLARASLAEAAVLGLAGGLLGVGLAVWTTGLLVAMAPAGVPGLADVRLTPAVLVFALVVSLVTALVIGALPAWRVGRADLQQQLRDATPGAMGGRRGRRVRDLLVVAEVALAVVLVVGAGLLLRSFAALRAVDPGFNAQHVLAFDVSLPGRYGREQSARFYQDLGAAIRALPGVSAAGATFGLPLSGFGYGISISSIDGRQLDDREQEQTPGVQVRPVTPGYLQTLGVRLVRGRMLAETDREGSAPAVVISESAARNLFGEADPIGHRFEIGTRLGLGPDRPRVGGEVVGVVADVHDRSLSRAARPTMYVAHQQFPVPGMSFAVRTTGEPALLTEPIRQALATLDPSVPMYQVTTMERLVGASASTTRFQAALLGGFALLALLLAAVGVYGVLAQGVAERTREIGVRVALGAGSHRVRSLVVRQGVMPATLGIAIGVVLALISTSLLTRVLAGMLFQVPPRDVATYAIAAVTLFGTALLAAWIPANRASRVDPMIALRSQ